jgi:pimeloyl-ACP methyl ester carboxylesterase
MPIVFVHGVPETAALWDDLRAALDRKDTIALTLPGFGCARPAGFGATKEEYVEWVIAELAAIGEPVDLVGHDWGGSFTIRVASVRPHLVRSWVSDAAGLADPQFQWHEVAKIWQTPGVGEQLFQAQLALPLEQRAAAFEPLGVPPARARAMAAQIDETMASCILALYRSAVDVGNQWAPALSQITAPGLVVMPGNDPFQVPGASLRAAERARAQVVDLDGLGHWWVLEAPERGAEMLTRFWKSLH